MKADEAFRAVAAFLGVRRVRVDEEEFADQQGGSVSEVVERERSRDEWAEGLLKRVRGD